jgi:hypothetical protein
LASPSKLRVVAPIGGFGSDLLLPTDDGGLGGVPWPSGEPPSGNLLQTDATAATPSPTELALDKGRQVLATGLTIANMGAYLSTFDGGPICLYATLLAGQYTHADLRQRAGGADPPRRSTPIAKPADQKRQ